MAHIIYGHIHIIHKFGTIFDVCYNVNFNYMDTVEKLVEITFKIPVTVSKNEDKEAENENALEKGEEILHMLSKNGEMWFLPVIETCEDFPYIKDYYSKLHYGCAREKIAKLSLTTK